MNKIAKSLYVIGVLCIFGGIMLGFMNYESLTLIENTLGDLEQVSQVSWSTFLAYAGAGLVSGFMMFGFGEIIYLLDKGNRLKEEELKRGA